MRRPKVSVIIPCYNAARFIEESVRSLLNQNLDDSVPVEIIVVDDGSSDGSAELVAALADVYDSVLCIRGPHRGIVPTVTRGLESARGDFIALQGADDTSSPDRIRLQLELLYRNSQVGLVFSDLEVIDSDGHVIASSFWRLANLNPERGRPIQRLLEENFVSGGTLLFRRELLEHMLPMPSILPFEDWWLAFCGALASEIDFLPYPLVRYRCHGANVVLRQDRTRSYVGLLKVYRETLQYRRALFEKLYESGCESCVRGLSERQVVECIATIDSQLKRLQGGISFAEYIKVLWRLVSRLLRRRTLGRKKVFRDLLLFLNPGFYYLAIRVKSGLRRLFA